MFYWLQIWSIHLTARLPHSPLESNRCLGRSPTYRALRAHWLSEMLLRRRKPASHIPMAQGPISLQLKTESIGLYTCQSNSSWAKLHRTCGGKTSAPVLPLVGQTHRSPFTSPHPEIHSFHTITGSIGVGSRPPIGRQDCPPLTRDRDRSLTQMSSLFVCDESRTTSHRCRRLLRNANRPPKRILPCACATNPGTRPFLRPLRLRKTRHSSRHYAGAVGSPPSPARHFTCSLSQAELLNAPA